jgi:hypothetical protein
LAVGVATSTGWAASLELESDDWEGLSQLLRLAKNELGPDRVAAPHALDLGALHPNDALVLVHPERKLAASDLASFLHAGGRIVLLDDFGTGDGLLAHFGIRRIALPERPAAMLRSNPQLALAESVGAHPVVRGVARVVTNHATGLTDTGLAPLLVVRGRGEPAVLFAVAGVVGHGRFLAVGDASVAMNAMLRYPGNRALALSLLRYAAAARDEGGDPPSGGETPAKATAPSPPVAGKVYILSNDFEFTGHYGPPSTWADAGRMTEEAFDALHHGVPSAAAYLVALVVGLAVVAWTSVRAGRTHRPSMPAFVRPTPLVLQGGVAGHAASLGATGASGALVMLELKTALEEALAARLGLDRMASADELVSRARESGLLGTGQAGVLQAMLADLALFERTDPAARRRASHVTVEEIAVAARRIEDLLGTIDKRQAW